MKARAISGLSHPNICALYDIGHQDGVDYLVMEYLEGETLSQRLSKGPLSTEQVLRYGIEIANALNKAHREKIVHRDLKPGNIMITRSGAKLLDFGLAKLGILSAILMSFSINPYKRPTSVPEFCSAFGSRWIAKIASNCKRFPRMNPTNADRLLTSFRA